MKKTILTGMVLILMLFLLSSCGVPQEDYDRVSSDLAAAQTEIQSLQGDLTAVRADLTKAEGDLAAAQDDLTKAQAQIQSLQGDKEATEEKRAEALAYAEFVDILMWPALVASEITPRFAFENAVEWLVELKNRASDLGDTKLSNYVKELDEPATFSALSDYCLDRVEQALK